MKLRTDIEYCEMQCNRKTKRRDKPLFALLWWLGGLDLLGTTEFLGTVLSFLPQFSCWPFLLSGQPGSNQPISGLKLFLRLLVIVDQRKSGALPSTKVCLEAESNDTSLVGLVEGSELLRELVLWDIRPGGVEDVNDELTSGQETVGDEFPCADGYWGVGHFWGFSTVLSVLIDDEGDVDGRERRLGDYFAR